ncbi:hypothetical protein PIB30_044000 [Stylosanthes scabra]|uniref:Uncharacterized protein n=1 Tax=Stylosanthes scabra TaxID=79078 RepID=A0ABU6VEG9_9FABA|nr:hypothetical protein [Stylosanthes scabra]
MDYASQCICEERARLCDSSKNPVMQPDSIDLSTLTFLDYQGRMRDLGNIPRSRRTRTAIICTHGSPNDSILLQLHSKESPTFICSTIHLFPGLMYFCVILIRSDLGKCTEPYK